LAECAVAVLVERGHHALSIAEVQRRSGASRGAVLHHFPTRAGPVESVVGELVARNERAVRAAAIGEDSSTDRVGRAMRALGAVLTEPSYAAELALWSAARTEASPRAALVRAERRAGRELARVVGDLLGERLTKHPRYPSRSS